MAAFGTTSPFGSVTCPVTVPRYSWALREVHERNMVQVRNRSESECEVRVENQFCDIDITFRRNSPLEEVRAMGEASKSMGANILQSSNNWELCKSRPFVLDLTVSAHSKRF